MVLSSSASRIPGSAGTHLASVSLVIAFYRFVTINFRATGMSLDDYGTFERHFRKIAGRRNLLGVPLNALYAIATWAIATAVAVVYALKPLTLVQLDNSLASAR